MPDIGPKPPQPPEGMEFVFANAFAGATRGTSAPLIFSKLRELRREVGSVAAERAKDVPFPVRGAKDLNQKLAQALDKLNLIAPVIEQKVQLIDVKDIPPNSKGDAMFRTMAHVQATIRLIAEDGSFIDMVGSGHGGDRDDKAGGKASTYAWKDAILKGLTIPHEDMVDTDDEAHTAPQGLAPHKAATPTPTPPAKPAPSKATVMPNKASVQDHTDKGPGFTHHDADACVTPSDPIGLKYVEAQIAKATSDNDLNVIKKAISDGTLSISGEDRLKASAAWMKKRKEILGDK